ncbi:unnamed protein product [Vitrella brassicaformis CCMP3155]|uniref:Major facilitator superfamily (MFS) profile domain-containing protein n=3 Tax=Vitrella brassicaformis TaxID=1169539 RepID=A0A0G4EA99_VITBC|nr:unnamed protein product [Vitrella brassicaformis CCMP3155]|eukprot:CEL92878.1 unnamed protein product [Vitrella brassicaformis CCMP3155]
MTKPPSALQSSLNWLQEMAQNPLSLVLQRAPRGFAALPTTDGGDDMEGGKEGAAKEATSNSQPQPQQPAAVKAFDPRAIVRHSQLLLFTLTYTSYAVLYSTRKPFSVVKTHIQNELGVSRFQLGTIDTAFLTAYALGQMFIPSLADRWGLRNVLFLAYAGSAVCCFIFAGTHNEKVLAYAWLGNGLLHAAAFPLFVKALSPWYSPTTRGSVLGVWTTSQQIGAMVATALAAFVAQHFGWRMAFYMPALVVAACGFALYSLLLEAPSPALAAVIATGAEKVAPAPSANDKGSPKAADDTANGDSRTSPRRMTVSSMASTSGGSEASDDHVVASSVGHRGPKAKMDAAAGKGNGEGNGVNVKTAGEERTESPKVVGGGSPGGGGAAGTGEGPGSAPTDAKSTSGSGEGANGGTHVVTTGAPVRRTFTFWDIVRMPYLLHVAGAYFFVKLIRYTLLFWLPYFLTQHLEYEASIAGYSSMMFDIGGIGGAIFTGYLSDHIMQGKRLQAAATMCLATATAILFFAYSTHIGFSAICFAMLVVGFTVAGPDSVLGAAAAQDLCEKSGLGLGALSTAAGVVNGMGSSGAVVQGYLTASISEALGWDSLFGVLCVMAVVSVLLLAPPMLADGRLRHRGGPAMNV